MNGEVERHETESERDMRLWLVTEQFTNDVALYQAAHHLHEPTVLNEDGNTYRALWALPRDDLERIIMLMVWDGGEASRRAQQIVTDARSAGAISV